MMAKSNEVSSVKPGKELALSEQGHVALEQFSPIATPHTHCTAVLTVTGTYVNLMVYVSSR